MMTLSSKTEVPAHTRCDGAHVLQDVSDATGSLPQIAPRRSEENIMPEVLFVEDDDTLRGLYAECLREAGFTVREARLAEEGLHALRRAAPDLVLLDLAMPHGEMSGTELLARL